MADHVRDPVLQRPERATASQARVPWTTAAQATLHCLTGCAIGEVLGMVIGTAAGLHDATTVALSIGLAFVFGYGLTMRGVLAAGVGLRDLFAAVFFVFFGLSTDPAQIPPVLLPAVILALITAATKIATGYWATRRAGIAVPGRWRAGGALVARGEFSIVIAGLAVAAHIGPRLGALATAYVLLLVILGPLTARYAEPFAQRLARHLVRPRPSHPDSPAPAPDAPHPQDGRPAARPDRCESGAVTVRNRSGGLEWE